MPFQLTMLGFLQFIKLNKNILETRRKRNYDNLYAYKILLKIPKGILRGAALTLCFFLTKIKLTYNTVEIGSHQSLGGTHLSGYWQRGG